LVLVFTLALLRGDNGVWKGVLRARRIVEAMRDARVLRRLLYFKRDGRSVE
jgi:hypothetical protein